MDTPRRGVRPTASLVREALFNILGEAVVGAAVVDLYAGAGTVGFEALSRGAASLLAVDRDPSVLALIRGTAERLGCSDRVRTEVGEVSRWLRGRPAEVPRADLVYIDAPYGDQALPTVLAELGAAPPALVVCEHHRAQSLPPAAGGLRCDREAVYGSTKLSFYARDVGAERRAPPSRRESP